jgi:hypothetical protein
MYIRRNLYENMAFFFLSFFLSFLLSLSLSLSLSLGSGELQPEQVCLDGTISEKHGEGLGLYLTV